MEAYRYGADFRDPAGRLHRAVRRRLVRRGARAARRLRRLAGARQPTRDGRACWPRALARAAARYAHIGVREVPGELRRVLERPQARTLETLHEGAPFARLVVLDHVQEPVRELLEAPHVRKPAGRIAVERGTIAGQSLLGQLDEGERVLQRKVHSLAAAGRDDVRGVADEEACCGTASARRRRCGAERAFAPRSAPRSARTPRSRASPATPARRARRAIPRTVSPIGHWT